MKQARYAIPLVATAVVGCGGRILDGDDATAPDVYEATVQPYAGEWCNEDIGPEDASATDADFFCGFNPDLDAWTHCVFAPGSVYPWNCCAADSLLCCPGAVNMTQLGSWVECCESKTSCQNCCNGIYPGPAYPQYQHDH